MERKNAYKICEMAFFMGKIDRNESKTSEKTPIKSAKRISL